MPALPVCWRAIFLPAVCDIPIGGMFWNLNGLNLTTLINSVKKALSSTATSPYMHFLPVLNQLNQRSSGLDVWLQQAAGKPDIFAREAFRYSSLAAQFPSLVTGAILASIPCVITISPLLDMRYLYAWHLFLHSVSSKSTAVANCFWNEVSHAWIIIPTWASCCLPSSLTSWNLLSRPARNACAQEFLMLCLCSMPIVALIVAFPSQARNGSTLGHRASSAVLVCCFLSSLPAPHRHCR